jgi:hypothetical protein
MIRMMQVLIGYPTDSLSIYSYVFSVRRYFFFLLFYHVFLVMGSATSSLFVDVLQRLKMESQVDIIMSTFKQVRSHCTSKEGPRGPF